MPLLVAGHTVKAGQATAILAAGATILVVAWRRLRTPKNVPYAPGHPLFGILPIMLRSLSTFSLHDDLAALHKRYGKTFAFHLVGSPCIMTHDPKNMQHILKTNFDNYVKGSYWREPLFELLGNGIFNTDGELWHHQRKTASKMFTKKVFETHIWNVVQGNMRKVDEILRKQGGAGLDMFGLLNRFTLDTIGQIGFSSSIGSLEDPSSPFLKSFDKAQNAMIKRMWTGTGVSMWKPLRALGLAWEKELPFHLRLLDDYATAMVESLFDRVDAGDEAATSCFVGLFLADPSLQEERKRDERAFRVYIRDMILNFLIAGRDTTAQAMTWTFYELMQCPRAVAAIREEVSQVCGSGAIEYQHLSKLHYVKAAVNEGLRLHPSIPLNAKLAVKSDVLPDGTTVPAGCFIQTTIWAQGRSEEIWGPDAEVFRPERWLDRTMPAPHEFTVFHAGPRECLGRRLAEMEMVSLIATINRDFDISLAIAPQDVHYDVQMTLGCSSGLPMKLQPRAA